jgi:hypothetical protein
MPFSGFWLIPGHPTFVRIVDRIALCGTSEQLSNVVPEILAYDEEFLFPPAEPGWDTTPVWSLEPKSGEEPNGRCLGEAIELLRGIWWLALRTHADYVQSSSETTRTSAGNRTSIAGVIDHLNRARSQIHMEWAALAQLIDDAMESRDHGHLYVAVEAASQWRYERDRSQEIDAQKAQWSDSLVRLQDNADHLARNRLRRELTTSRQKVEWDTFGRLIDDALRNGDVAQLRVASLAETILEGKWWEWWEDGR